MFKRRKTILATIGIALVATYLVYRSRNSTQASSSAVPTEVSVQDGDSKTRAATMAEVLQLARESRDMMSTGLDDYTARFVKQEIDTSGAMTEVSEIFMKVHTRLRNEADDAPMRVYLSFRAPDSVKGREVIWAEDMHGGMMQVKEAGLLGLMTIALDPNGLIAMRGQRYPISEIGLKRLVEKLIERGEQDLDNPDVTATITKDYMIGDVPAQLVQVRRAKPSGNEDDFSLAEIAFDPERKLILMYRSFGWPAESVDQDPAASGELPLQETYTYHDIKTNVGLTKADFETTNPAYSFP